MTFTSHYITEDWRVTTVVLLTRSLPGRHTADHLTEKLKEAVEDVGLRLKWCTTTQGHHQSTKTEFCFNWLVEQRWVVVAVLSDWTVTKLDTAKIVELKEEYWRLMEDGCQFKTHWGGNDSDVGGDRCLHQQHLPNHIWPHQWTSREERRRREWWNLREKTCFLARFRYFSDPVSDFISQNQEATHLAAYSDHHWIL